MNESGSWFEARREAGEAAAQPLRGRSEAESEEC